MSKRTEIALTKEDFKRYMAPFLVWCPEDKVYRYVLHIHLASVLHGDLRMEYCGRDLIGVTLFLYKSGTLKKRPNGKEGWRDFLKIVKNPKYFKLNFKTGEIVGQRSLQCTAKLPESKAWYKVNKFISPPGWIGAASLKKYWGYMTVVDRGTVEHLTRKLDMVEFYFHGKAFRGRYILRPFGKNFEFFSASVKPVVTGTTYEKLKEGKELGGFLWIKPVDQTPYVLSLRAVQKKFVPPKGFSGLPRDLKKRIPLEYQYWKFDDKEKRIEVRDGLREELKGKRLLRYLEKGEWRQIQLEA